MQELPHHYQVSATAGAEGTVTLEGHSLPPLETAPPIEFGGPGGYWSPEAMLVGAVTDCFILSFRAVARASKLDWINIECSTEGTLERVERVNRFTELTVTAHLSVAAGTDTKKAQQLLEKAESVCLISNSLSSTVHLKATVGEIS
ncbi:osmotically inducible protein OsmC [Kineobactrum sediminis]|uniref:Osmotically inducible protein OsmC n=1 Tax=Kineobactrum sediminis TaxID=1905677 RepID=A0A2N5Y607_9GAMM|nr:OsmC family protein [Kineobactrum sediminis]PLW83825.1 osmotically inducible protein OsmC [Kineobactrum sediminis]